MDVEGGLQSRTLDGGLPVQLFLYHNPTSQILTEFTDFLMSIFW